ncbi:LysM peptidoglycan-binding domain-containing protein [Paenibacillus sp. GCM10012306]|uniref:LysM peptidoglycan-binding domain-containing protein n=1 Tax=Paenibacillus sp. GCM10012306 TaxID=3317342 RepID=UPI0036190151
MLKYSTYHSIYDKDTEVSSVGQTLGSGLINRIQEITNVLSNGLSQLIRTFNFYKIALFLLLIVAGFTVVGNVFAGPVNLAKQEKRVVVEQGDTLWSIALRYKPTNMKTAVYIEGIKRSSQLTDSTIHAGDVLTVPLF